MLAATVNPLAGVDNPTTFHPDAVYRFFIDTDGDVIVSAGDGIYRLAAADGAISASATLLAKSPLRM